MKILWKTALICLLLSITACEIPGPNDTADVEQPAQVEVADIPELNLEGYIPVYMYEILDPQPGEILALAPYLIRFSGHSFGGISEFEVRVDGNVVGTVPPLGYGSGGPAYGHFFYSEFLWTPDDYGDQVIAIRARASGFLMYSDFLEVQVTVAPIAISEQLSQLPEMVILPECTPADLVPPVLFSPEPFASVGAGPTEGSIPPDLLAWFYTGGCIPDLYKIKFSPDPTFGWARAGRAEGYYTHWPIAGEPPQVPLEPATQYYWTVRAWTDGVNGPDAPVSVFFTGPSCSSASGLIAPQLLSPDDGAQVDSLFATLHFQPGEPKCLPDGYFIDLQTKSDFSGSTLLGTVSTPDTYVLTDELEDCTTYYWRVAATKGSMTGPFSEVRSFFTNQTGYCPAQAPQLPFIEALLDQRCYQGPDPRKYPISGYFLMGELAEIAAQDLRGEWWAIPNPDGNDYCFVRKVDNKITGETSDVPMWRDPELEEDVPELVCRSNLNEEQCKAAGGTWKEAVTGAASFCQCE